MENISCDVLIIGAGPAGSIAAAMVHKAGFSVRVVEKEKFPRFVIGESLLPRCMEVLEECDLLEAIKDQNFQEKFGAKFVKGDAVADYNFSDQFTEGWSWTWQVPRADFDMALIDAVRKRGVPVNFETTVTNIVFQTDEQSTTTTRNVDGQTSEITARFIIDASGYGRVIPKLFNLDEPSSLTPRRAIFAHMEDPRRSRFEESNRITIVNYAPGAWVWIIPFSTGITSLGFVSNADFFNKIEGPIDHQFQILIDNLPYLKERFGESKNIFDTRKLEGWSSKAGKFYGNGFVLTGNVTEFLDPIFSSGVMFATVSSHLAASLVIRKLKGEAIDWEEEYSKVLQSGVDVFRVFVNAWYDGTLETIFYHKEQDTLLKRQVCSVLAGYVWDKTNPFVAEPKGSLRRIASMIRFDENMKAPMKGK